MGVVIDKRIPENAAGTAKLERGATPKGVSIVVPFRNTPLRRRIRQVHV